MNWADAVRQQRLQIMLNEVTSILNKYQIDYWLAFGTALGQIRENDVIKGDLDGDLAMLETNQTQLLMCMNDLLCCGYYVQRRPTYFRIALDYDFLHVDVQLWRLEGEQLSFKTSGMTRPATFPVGMILPTQKVEFVGGDVQIVHKPVEFVEYMYGKTWSTPRRFDKGIFNGGYVAWMSLIEPIIATYGPIIQFVKQGNWATFKQENARHAQEYCNQADKKEEK